MGHTKLTTSILPYNRTSDNERRFLCHRETLFGYYIASIPPLNPNSSKVSRFRNSLWMVRNKKD